MIHSFLLIGQSNMAGRGYIEDAENIDTSRIKILRNGCWVDMFRPINPDRSFSGVSLAESFAESYAEKYDVDVGLVCCADGGTRLEQWKKGGLLYDNAVYQAKLAQRTSVISGILWHQGEADCDEALYPTYEERLTEFVNSLRNELDLHDVPFLIGGLGNFLSECSLNDNLKNYTHINEAMKNVAQKDEMMSYVTADGLTSNPDHLHFNSKSLYEFGRRYFCEFEKISKETKTDVVKGCDDSHRTDMERL